MSRIAQIIQDAREPLADQAKDRWSDNRLLQLVDAGQKDLARYSKILQDEIAITLSPGRAIYQLPDFVWLLTRASADSQYVPFKSFEDFDRAEFVDKLDYDTSLNFSYQHSYYTDFPKDSWENDVGSEVLSILYDRRNLATFRIYPILNDTINDVQYNFAQGGTVEFEGDEFAGIVASISDYTFNSPFGIIVDMFDSNVEEEIFTSPFGVVANIEETSYQLNLWYVRDPEPLTSIDDQLETPRIFDTAIRYYVIAHAFLDDIDAGSEAKANRFLGLYERELELAMETRSRNGVQKAAVHTTGYRNAFE